jgi:hypothetical protein
MRYKLSVFGASWAIILGLEYLFDVPVAAMGSDPFGQRFLIAVLLAAGATFFWMQLLSRRRLPPVVGEDSEIMGVKASLLPQFYAAYTRLKADLLDKLGENVLVETEEALYAESLVWRRQYQANPNPDNKAKWALFILEYGTPEEIRKLLADAKAQGWGKK